MVESPRERRSIQTVILNEAVFVRYLDPGTWHLAFYNDGREKEAVSFNTVALGESPGTALQGGEEKGGGGDGRGPAHPSVEGGSQLRRNEKN